MDHSWQPIYMLKKSFFKKLYWIPKIFYWRCSGYPRLPVMLFRPMLSPQSKNYSGYYTLMVPRSCWTHLCCLVCAFPDQDIKVCSRRGGCLVPGSTSMASGFWHPLNLITFVSTWIRGNSCRFIYCRWGAERVEKHFPLKGCIIMEVWKKESDSYLEKRMLLHVARDGCSRFTVSS